MAAGEAGPVGVGAGSETGENGKLLLSFLCGDSKTGWLAFPFSFCVRKEMFQGFIA